MKPMAKIIPIENGPLLAKEVPVLTSQAGENIDPGKPAYGLCRCGQSKNKPFCDGSHTAVGFTSDNGDAKIRNNPVQYSAEVEGQKVTVSYTPVLCGHIAECQRLQKTVFDPTKKPWIQPENGTVEGIKSVIAACPSGALRVAFEDEDPSHIDSDDIAVSVVQHGPYIVKNIDLEAEFNGAGASQKEFILCRCGQSRNKPFCDGSHHDVKWRDDV